MEENGGLKRGRESRTAEKMDRDEMLLSIYCLKQHGPAGKVENTVKNQLKKLNKLNTEA